MGNGATKKTRNSINGKLNILTSGGLLKSPWRPMSWDEQTRFQLIETIKEYQPLTQVGVTCARILLLGQVNVGKSSFFNTVNSIFRNHVTAQAPVGSPRDQRSITTKMRAYSVRNGREGKVLNFKIVDAMGIEGEHLKGFNPSELPYLLDGHVPDNHQFDPTGNISPEMNGYLQLPKLEDKIHCCVLVLDATKVASVSPDLLNKMAEMRIKITNRGIPLIVLLTKIDQACNYVANDVSVVYRSTVIRDIMALASVKIGVPVSHILPVKNYTRELELDTYVDVLVLSAIQQMLRFTDNYFDECLVHTKTGYVQPEKRSNDLWTQKATLRSTSFENNVKEAWPNNTSLNPATDMGGIPGADIQHPSLGKSVFSNKLDSPVIAPNHAEKKLETLEEVKNENGSQEELIGKQANMKETPNLKQLNGANMNELIMQEAA